MHPQHLNLLRSPETGGSLRIESADYAGSRIRNGHLIDEAGNRFPIVDFIPRFVSSDNYCQSFTVEWDRWRDILSTYSGYGERFTKETRWPADLSGELILEAGCGSGAFTEHALGTGATVVSFDYSSGVETNYARNGENDRLLVVQASIFDMPFAPASFDRLFCFGVIQHTPDPREAFEKLVTMVKPGGSLAADIYLDPPDWATLERAKYFWRRRLAGRYDAATLLRYVETYVRLAWPLARVIERTPFRKVNRWALFDNYKPRLPGMDPARYRDFAALDIFDFLSPAFDQPETVDGFKAWFVEAGLTEIDVHQGYNGVEGRGVRPLDAAGPNA